MARATRRDLLRHLAGGAVLLPARPLRASEGEHDELLGAEGLPLLDVAVVGGGVGGAYVAWRLQTGNTAESAVLRPLLAARGRRGLQVALFERSDRIGGRLYSYSPPGMPHLRAELGGMRFLTSQQLVARLVDHLGLPHRPFPGGTDDHLLYVRRRRLRRGDISNPDLVPYNLGEDAGKSPGELLVQAIEAHVPDAFSHSAREWDRLKPALSDGRLPYYRQGFWSLLLRTLNAESYAFLRDGLNYLTLVDNWNAVEALAYLSLDLAPGFEYRALTGGYQSLPLELVRQFRKKGGRLRLRQELVSIRRAARGGERVLRLEFREPESRRRSAVDARHVVLALPQLPIRRIASSSFLWEIGQFREDLRSVAAQPAAKLLLAYPDPWWRELGLPPGRSETDLPLNQCYYLETEGEQPGADPSNRNSLMLATYHDGANVGFWAGFRESEPYLPDGVPPVPPDLRASVTMVEEIQRQIREVHGPEARVPEPYAAVYANWADEPYGGGWHLWRIGARSWEVMPRMRRPAPGTNLYICGEAWSTQQGWVEGPLMTAERVLEGELGLPRPRWLPQDYYLGS